MNLSGFLISIEGIDGSGKSTLARSLAERLRVRNTVVLTKEPGGTQVGQRIRAMVQHEVVAPMAEFLLFPADRAHHMQSLIKPALERGEVVISDRMGDSSMAYQGYGRGVSLELVDTVNRAVSLGIMPQVTIYLACDLVTARARIEARQEKKTIFEAQNEQFFERVIQGFETVFSNRKGLIRLDARKSPEALLEETLEVLARVYNVR